jgi:hypothetical protein
VQRELGLRRKLYPYQLAMIALNFTIGTGTLAQRVDGSAINFLTRV